MSPLIVGALTVLVLAFILASSSIEIPKENERAVVFRLGRLTVPADAVAASKGAIPIQS